MSKRPLRPVAVLMLALHLTACAAWTPAPADLRATVSAGEGQRVRVLTRDGNREVVTKPRIIRDTLYAVERDCRAALAQGRGTCADDLQPVVALDDVVSTEVQTFSAGRTLALVVFPLAALFIWLQISEPFNP